MRTERYIIENSAVFGGIITTLITVFSYSAYDIHRLFPRYMSTTLTELLTESTKYLSAPSTTTLVVPIVECYGGRSRPPVRSVLAFISDVDMV